MKGLIVLVILFIIGVIATIAVLISEYVEEGYSDCDPYIKFQSFKSFYSINPKRWDLHDDYVQYNVPGSRRRVYLHFNLIDYYRYKYWYHHLECRDRERNNAKELCMVIEGVKKDIQDYEKQYKTEMRDKIQDILDTKATTEDIFKQFNTKQND